MRKREEIVGGFESLWWHARRPNGGWMIEGLSWTRSLPNGLPVSWSDAKTDWPVLAEIIKAPHVLLIGLIGDRSHRKAFRQKRVENVRILVDEKGRRFSVVPIAELTKLITEYEFCFAEWPESANDGEIESLAGWEPWDIAPSTCPRLMEFLRRSGSRFMYIWEDGRNRVIVETAPLLAAALLRDRLQTRASFSDSSVVPQLTDQQVLALFELEGDFEILSNSVRVDSDQMELTVWRRSDGAYSQSRHYILRSGAVVAAEWASSEVPEELREPYRDDPKWWSVPIIIFVVMALLLLWFVCQRIIQG